MVQPHPDPTAHNILVSQLNASVVQEAEELRTQLQDAKLELALADTQSSKESTWWV